MLWNISRTWPKQRAWVTCGMSRRLLKLRKRDIRGGEGIASLHRCEEWRMLRLPVINNMVYVGKSLIECYYYKWYSVRFLSYVFLWGRGFVKEGVLCETVFISSVNEMCGECVETFGKEIICFNTLVEKFPQFSWGMLKEFLISVSFSDIGQEIQFILLIMVIKNSEVTRPFIRIKKIKILATRKA